MLSQVVIRQRTDARGKAEIWTQDSDVLQNNTINNFFLKTVMDNE